MNYKSPSSLMVGHRIRNERLALGMTQAEFARLLGISSSYLGALERGSRPVSRTIMNRLHEKIHISYDYLMEGEELPAMANSHVFPSNTVAEPDAYKVRRNISIMLSTCTLHEAKDCYKLVHTYLDRLHKGT